VLDENAAEVVAATEATSITLREAAQDYLAAYSGSDPSRLHRVTAWVDLLGNVAMTDITPPMVASGLRTLEQQPNLSFRGRDAFGKPVFKAKPVERSPATLNRYAAALAAVFTWSRDAGHIPWAHPSPCSAVKKRSESRGRVRYLTTAEIQRLLTACRASTWKRLYLLVLMALTTGARRGELQALRWQDVNLDKREATLHRTKNGDTRILILTDPVVTELEQFAGKDRNALVFRSKDYPGKPFIFEPSWHIAMKAAGIQDFRFHDLRHTSASIMAQNGISLLEIAEQLGHRQLVMVKRYAHISTERRHKTVDSIFGEIT